METSVNNGMCRCCASEGTFKDVRSTYHWMGEEEIYADMLKECFDILLSKSEADNAGGICEVCITQLRNAANFKKQVLHTEEQFKKHFHNKIFKPIKLEVSRDGDELESDNNLSDDFSTDFDLPIKEEIEEPKPKKRTSAVKATTSKAKKAKVEGETSVKRERDGNEKPKVKTKRADNRYTISMKHRINASIILKYSNATPLSTHQSETGFKCAYCDTLFKHPADLKTHSMAHGDEDINKFVSKFQAHKLIIKLDITSLKCNICTTKFVNIKDLIQHLIDVHGKTYYTDMDNHIMPFEFNENILKCLFCGKEFKIFKCLQEHMTIHYNNYNCNVCEMGFLNKRLLNVHMGVAHEIGSYKCDHCDKVFETLRRKKSHIRQVHKKVAANKCRICNEHFRDHWRKLDHMEKAHGMKRELSECLACGKTYKRPTHLMAHMKQAHLMERRHKCTECEASFYGRSALADHMVVHTGAKKFKCDICDKAFGRKYTLTQHFRVHEDDRKFKCEYCRKAFVLECNLKGHMTSKHGDIYS